MSITGGNGAFSLACSIGAMLRGQPQMGRCRDRHYADDTGEINAGGTVAAFLFIDVLFL